MSLPRQASKRESPKVETVPLEWRMTKPVLKAAICVAGGVQGKMASGLGDDTDEYLMSLLLSWVFLSWAMVRIWPEVFSADV